MKVGILGSGDVGQALGSGFVNRGHDVKLASRNPNGKAPAAWLSKVNGKASTGTYEEAAKHGEVLVLATRGAVVEDVIRSAGTRNFAGKLVIDVTNPLDFQGPTPGLFVGVTDSLAERIQRLVPDAKVVKAFNSVPSTQMVDPKFSGGAPQMLIGGNDGPRRRSSSRSSRSSAGRGPSTWAGSRRPGGSKPTSRSGSSRGPRSGAGTTRSRRSTGRGYPRTRVTGSACAASRHRCFQT